MEVIRIVKGAVVYKDTILLVTRASHVLNNPGRETFPGGHVENNESLKSAVRREIKEEVGLDVRVVAELSERTLPAKEPNTSLHITTFLCYVTSDNVSLDTNELSAYRWVSCNNLPANVPQRIRDEVQKILHYQEKSL